MSVIKLSQTVQYQDVGAETVILDLENGHYFELNSMGSDMLKLLQECSDMDSVVQALFDRYAVTKETLRSDLEALLASLKQNGLVEST